MIKCIIVDDERLAQQVIQNHLQKIPGFQIMATCNNAAEAAAALRNFEVDLIFLDIQLPGITGLHFLRSLIDPPLVILTTAYAEYAVESYEFNVIDYLLKPISFERFKRAINKLTDDRIFFQNNLEKMPPSTEHIFIKSGSKFFRINFPEIQYVEAMKDYLKIHTADFRLVTLQTMGEMEKILPSKQFIRVHKSFIVGVSHIRTVYGNSIELEKTTIPIGISYKTNVMNFIARR
jgi:DNA-binding LytR/AlgR family response regulator